MNKTLKDNQTIVIIGNSDGVVYEIFDARFGSEELLRLISATIKVKQLTTKEPPDDNNRTI